MSNQTDFTKAEEILLAHDHNPSQLIAILQEVQAAYRYLPGDVLEYVAKGVGITPAKIYGVATFYENFSLEPKGKYVIKVCDGTACHVRKSIPILERLREELGLSEKKHTTDDMVFTVETVACLGACGLGPIVTVNGKVYSAMTPDKASELIKSLKEEA